MKTTHFNSLNFCRTWKITGRIKKLEMETVDSRKFIKKLPVQKQFESASWGSLKSEKELSLSNMLK